MILRMRHKDVSQAWNDIVNSLREYKIPCKTVKIGRGFIRAWTTKIYVKGCYTTNSTETTLLGMSIQNADYGIITFEEAKEFDQKTVDAVLVATRGIQSQVIIYRSNPYLLTNWFVQKCYRELKLDEDRLVSGDGNQWEVKDNKIYHYMRADINPFMSGPSKDYLERIKEDNPMKARLSSMDYQESTKEWSLLIFTTTLSQWKTCFVIKEPN